MKDLTFLSLTNKTLDLPKNVISAGINSTSQFNTIKKFLESNTIKRTIFLTPIQDYEFEVKNGMKNSRIKIINVPGVFEIPVTISKNLKKYDGFLALGCVIKGQTPHFDFISKASTEAIMQLSISSKKPIGNGIITCLSLKQAIARKKKGAEAANAVLSILSQR